MSKVERIITYLREFYKHHPNEAAGFYLGIAHAGVWTDKFVSFEELDAGKLPIDEETLNNADIYHSIFPYKNNRGRKKENAVTKTNYLIFDVEKEGHQEARDEEIRAVASQLTEFFKEKAIDTAIKLSGRGIHIYVKTHIDLDDDMHRELYRNIRELMNVVLPEGWKSDNINDESRVIRVPYTKNQKNKKLVVWFNKDISELEETTFEKLRALYEEFKAIYEKEQKAKRETEKEFETEGVLELDDEKLRELAKELVLIWKDYWVTGVRHYLSLALAGFIRKNTALTQEQAEELFSEFLALIGDEESRDRLRALADSYSKKEIASVSILLKKTEDKYELTGVGKTLASVLRLSDEEMVERLVKLFEDTREVFQKFAIARLKRSLIGKLFIEKSDRKLVAVEVYRNRVVVATYLKNEAGIWRRAKESVVIDAKVRLLNARVVIKENDDEELYTMFFDAGADRKFYMKNMTVTDIAKSLEKKPSVVSARNKMELIRVLQAAIKILKRAYNIEFETVWTAFDVVYDSDAGLYKFTGRFLNVDDDSVIDTQANVSIDDFVKFAELMNMVKDDRLLMIYLGHTFSIPFNFETRLKPLVWVWGEAGTGKTTLVGKLTERLFIVETKNPDIFGSETSIYRFLRASESRLPLVIDDVKRVAGAFMNIMKSYATGQELYIRGTGTVRRDERFRTRAGIFVTANQQFFVDEESIMTRVINVNVTDDIFADSDVANELIEELAPGLGFRILESMITSLNNDRRRFKELVKAIAPTIAVDFRDGRRRLIYAQFLAALSRLYVIFSAFNEEWPHEEVQEFVERLERILHRKYNELIAEIEREQEGKILGNIILSALNRLWDAPEDYGIIKESNGMIVYVTREGFYRLKERYQEFEKFVSIASFVREVNNIARNMGVGKIATRTKKKDPLTGRYVDAYKFEMARVRELNEIVNNPDAVNRETRSPLQAALPL